MILRRTQSLCPICLRRIEAVYERPETAGTEKGVFLRKTCPEHGVFSVPAWVALEPVDAQGVVPGVVNAPPFESWSRPKSPSYPEEPRTAVARGCPFDCGLCPLHAQHTCTGLVEVTMRCDLACPVCYAGAGRTEGTLPPDPPLAALAAQLDSLKTASGACNVQISGGEPTIREDLPAIVTLARERGFGLVQLNTNGLRLGRDAGYAARLRAAGLDSVYLQWDGVREAVFETMRGRACLNLKRLAVEACAAAGLGVVLVATLARHVNDGEVGDLLRLALALGPAVRGVHFQPVSSFGRYPWDLSNAPRLTLPEVMAALVRQAPELVRMEHFHPPGCEHALCSFSAAYRRTGVEGAELEWLPQAGQPCCSPVPPPAAEGARKARQFVALHWKGAERIPAADTPGGAALPERADDFSRFLNRAGAERRFTVSAMAFQDAYSLDLERVRGCCIHVVQADGRLVPFCLHNLTARDGARLYSGAWA